MVFIPPSSGGAKPEPAAVPEQRIFRCEECSMEAADVRGYPVPSGDSSIYLCDSGVEETRKWFDPYVTPSFKKSQ